jgi:hypothetical protein
MTRQWETQTDSLSRTSPRRIFNAAVSETFTTGQSRKTSIDLKNCSTKIQGEPTFVYFVESRSVF